MHLTFGYFVLYTQIYRLTERKKRFHVQNCPCGTVGAKIGNVLGLLVHGKVDVEFGRNVFFVDCLIWKILNMAKISITWCAKAFFMHTKTSKCNNSGKPNCDEVSKWRLSVGSSSSCPCQYRYEVGTGLRIMSRG